MARLHDKSETRELAEAVKEAGADIANGLHNFADALRDLTACLREREREPWQGDADEEEEDS